MNLTHLYDFLRKNPLCYFFRNNAYNNYYYDFSFTKKNAILEKKFIFFHNRDFFKTFFLMISWWKARILYYLNNWVYTTNHKRIAINYFWFVILSGIIGMVLATVIRLELAYPGVGIFAGDSLQYLSLVTAHGVIMVFFMIMPLIFGAFANFLLPTQLGVHDVAFPRLNSAAFWFLPSGLIMLAQLICVDRRYQRMNCFNIREVQALLKRKFFADLVNSNDCRNFLNQTMVGTRYKVASENAVNPNFLLFYNYGTTLSPKTRSSLLKFLPTKNVLSETFISKFSLYTITKIQQNFFFSSLTRLYLYFFNHSRLTPVECSFIFQNCIASFIFLVWNPSQFYMSNYENFRIFFKPFYVLKFFFNSSLITPYLVIEHEVVMRELAFYDFWYDVFKNPKMLWSIFFIDTPLKTYDSFFDILINQEKLQMRIRFLCLKFLKPFINVLYYRDFTLWKNIWETTRIDEDSFEFILNNRLLNVFQKDRTVLWNIFFDSWVNQQELWLLIETYLLKTCKILLPTSCYYYFYTFIDVETLQTIVRSFLAKILHTDKTGYDLVVYLWKRYEYYELEALRWWLRSFKIGPGDPNGIYFEVWTQTNEFWKIARSLWKILFKKSYSLIISILKFIRSWVVDISNPVIIPVFKPIYDFILMLWDTYQELELRALRAWLKTFKIGPGDPHGIYFEVFSDFEESWKIIRLVWLNFFKFTRYLLNELIAFVMKLCRVWKNEFLVFEDVNVRYFLKQFDFFYAKLFDTFPKLEIIEKRIERYSDFNFNLWLSARWIKKITKIIDYRIERELYNWRLHIEKKEGIAYFTNFILNWFFFKISQLTNFELWLKKFFKAVYDFSIESLKLTLTIIDNLFFFIWENFKTFKNDTLFISFYDSHLDIHYFFFPRTLYFFWFKNLDKNTTFASKPLSWQIVKNTSNFFRYWFLDVVHTTYRFAFLFFKIFFEFIFNLFTYTTIIPLTQNVVTHSTVETIPSFTENSFWYNLRKCFWNFVFYKYQISKSSFENFFYNFFLLPLNLFELYQVYSLNTLLFIFNDFFFSYQKTSNVESLFVLLRIKFNEFLENVEICIHNWEYFLPHQTLPIFKFIYIYWAPLNEWFFKYSKNHINALILNFKSAYFVNFSLKLENTVGNQETVFDSRNHKFENPIFKYDYKSGDYFSKLYKEVYDHLFTTIAVLTGNFRKSPWFFSESHLELLNNNAVSALVNLTKLTSVSNETHYWTPIWVNGTNSFYNFFFTLFNDNRSYNLRWISLDTLNQKFYRMFNTSAMQQRVYTNWRNIKFTREAWRCKLLSARHQKTLFRRYVSEDNVFWSIERNARDLLPGWAMITPFSSRTRFTAIGKVDIGLMAVLLVLNSSLISAANFLVTYRYLSTLNNRKMRDARSFFTEGVMVASWMMIAANPMLVIGIIMLLSDRHWQTSFFDYSGGGDTILFQHMFWFFGHPEVYIIIIPVFGFTNTILSYYLKKRISARASLLYSMYTIAFLGFFVWGHHMYMVGLAHTTRMLFSTLTVMISVPAATKLMHWCVTIVNSSMTVELPLICIFTFIFFFISGGISGMFVAHTGMDVLFHDTFYVIGHFHVMFAGAAMIGCFGAFYFYFPAIFGVKYNRIFAYLHYVYYLLGQLFTLVPMFWLGYAGMPRRVLDYPASFGGWHSVISGGHMLSVAGMLAFFIMIFDSMRQGKAAIRNTLGVGRYNTRLNFYIYEIARLHFVQQKGWSFYRLFHYKFLKLNNLYYTNLEHLETTLYSYVFVKQ